MDPMRITTNTMERSEPMSETTDDLTSAIELLKHAKIDDLPYHRYPTADVQCPTCAHELAATGWSDDAKDLYTVHDLINAMTLAQVVACVRIARHHKISLLGILESAQFDMSFGEIQKKSATSVLLVQLPTILLGVSPDGDVNS